MWKFIMGISLGIVVASTSTGLSQFFGQDDPYGYNQQQNRWNQEELLQEQRETNRLLNELTPPIIRSNPC